MQRYFNLLNNQFLPSLTTGETANTTIQFDLMTESFDAHREAIEDLLPKIRAHIAKNEQKAETIQNQVVWSVALFSAGLLLLGLIILFIAYKVSVKPLMHVARDIYEGTEHSRQASSQLTEASQKLA